MGPIYKNKVCSLRILSSAQLLHGEMCPQQIPVIVWIGRRVAEQTLDGLLRESSTSSGEGSSHPKTARAEERNEKLYLPASQMPFVQCQAPTRSDHAWKPIRAPKARIRAPKGWIQAPGETQDSRTAKGRLRTAPSDSRTGTDRFVHQTKRTIAHQTGKIRALKRVLRAPRLQDSRLGRCARTTIVRLRQ